MIFDYEHGGKELECSACHLATRRLIYCLCFAVI